MGLKIKIKKKNAGMGLYTIGHSNHSAEVFLEYLKNHGITMLIDVRSKPYSRYNPHFNKDRLSALLKKAGVGYKWGGEQLGGMSELSIKDNDFIEKMNTVVDLSKKHKLAMMCSEGDPRKCHRAYKLSAWFHRNCEGGLQHITKQGLVDSEGLEKSLPDSWVWFEYGGEAT